MQVVVSSPIAISSSQKQTLQKAVEKKYGKVEMVEVVDPSLIGGVKVTIGSHQIDATVKSKLNQLKQQLG